jgi:dTDP-4-dehydrorhamnose 3,5-epimerase
VLAVERLEIQGVFLVQPQRFGDARGYFVETYNARQFAEAGIGCVFLQDNQSLSARPGTIRGLHFQTPPAVQNKLVRVIRGAIFDVAVDLRRGSASYGRWCGATLSDDNGAQLFIPVGFAHGFCTLAPDTVVTYKVDGYYAPACDDGLRWDDPDIGIEWPLAGGQPIISNKDAKLPSFKDFVSPFEAP